MLLLLLFALLSLHKLQSALSLGMRVMMTFVLTQQCTSTDC